MANLIKIKQASYTLPKGLRVVPAGTYSSSDFSPTEIEYLKSIGSLVIEEKQEEKTIKPTRKRQEQNQKIIHKELN